MYNTGWILDWGPYLNSLQHMALSALNVSNSLVLNGIKSGCKWSSTHIGIVSKYSLVCFGHNMNQTSQSLLSHCTCSSPTAIQTAAIVVGGGGRVCALWTADPPYPLIPINKPVWLHVTKYLEEGPGMTPRECLSMWESVVTFTINQLPEWLV